MIHTRQQHRCTLSEDLRIASCPTSVKDSAVLVSNAGQDDREAGEVLVGMGKPSETLCARLRLELAVNGVEVGRVDGAAVDADL